MRQVLSRSLITVAAAGGVLAMTGGYAHADAEARTHTSNSPGVLSGNSVEVPVDLPVNVCGNSVNAVALLNPAMGNGCSNESAPEHQRHAPAHQRHAPAPAPHTQAPAHGNAQHGSSQHGSSQHGNAQQGDQYGAHHGAQHSSHHGMRQDDSTTVGSPGVGSGNNARVPVEAPVNVCGNTADLVGLLNPVMGNDCGGTPVAAPPTDRKPPTHPTPPPVHHTPPPSTHVVPPSVVQVTPPRHAAAVLPVLAQGAQLARTGSGGLGTAGAVSAGLLLSGAMLYRRTRTARV
ncbi:chaplin [Streptomyces sp. H39-S7]|uniref:chaplin n=1 Tax=Streptomyces sp. H39-S7 TaxID=3004357 RepID=UPI0022AFB8A3|nr:chaplin [Streptomyces sp. H39-S7]